MTPTQPRHKTRRTLWGFGLLTAAAVFGGAVFWGCHKNGGTAQPDTVLYIAQLDQQGEVSFVPLKQAQFSDPNLAGLVVVTHGWVEYTEWAQNMAASIREQVDSPRWVVGWLDWRVHARKINPRDAAKYARETAGPMLGDLITEKFSGVKHIHLIGHSAGSWVISEAAAQATQEMDCSVHLTFLDAYVPGNWEAELLGKAAQEQADVYWAEQYLTHDLTMKVTEISLPHAHNVDITDVDPTFADHRFSFYWYHGSVLGEFASDDDYAGKDFYNTAEERTYGWPRSLEADPENWQQSLTLELGNDPVTIKKP